MVEDNIIVADVLCSLLIKSGYDVTEPAISYYSAIKVIEEEKPDLVLLDVDLSGDKNGIDLAQKVNQDFQLPFAFVTAHDDESLMSKAYQTNPFAYLLKPVENELLLQSIESGYKKFMAERSRSHSELNNGLGFQNEQSIL